MAYLHETGVPIRSFRDLKAQPLERAEVEHLARKVGGAEKLFSRRAMKYRSMGLHEQTLSEDDLLRLMTEEYTLYAPGGRAWRACDGRILDEEGGRAGGLTVQRT